MIRGRISGLLLLLGSVALLARPASAETIVTCSADFSTCYIPENTFLQFPSDLGVVVAGDVVLLDPNGAVSDVFRIFNDVFDSGSGTGLGTTAFLYSSDDGTPLPNPSTYSANVQFIPESTTSPQTDYFNNGILYVLAAPEPSARALFVVGCLLLFIAHRKKAPVWKTALFLALALFCLPAFSQNLPVIEPLPDSAVKFDEPLSMGPAQSVSVAQVPSFPGLAFYTANYAALGGREIPINIVGTDPALGANTTTVNSVIIPLNMVFAGEGNLAFDATTQAGLTAASPIFAVADYTTGGTDLGTTQYGDAILRAEFWNLPGFSPDHHVLLGGPTILPTVTVNVPASLGTAYRLSTGTLLGVVQNDAFNSLLTQLAQSFNPQVLPVFLTDDVVLSGSGTISDCCILGFHASEGPPISTAQTWIYAAWTESGIFAPAVLDVWALSHEIGEWLNDPFANAFLVGGVNLIPPAILPGQGGACISNFESADPLEAPAVAFTQATNGRTYHLTDQVFLPWYLHTSPSFSVNGFYTYLNTFPTYSTLCGPG